MSQTRGFNYMYNEGPSPFLPLMLVGIAVMWIALPWYFSYESTVEEAQEQWNLVLVVLVILLMLALVYLATPSDSSAANALNYILPQSDPSSIHRMGGSPVGLGILLFIVLTMVWYHSDIIDSWNPLKR